MNFRTLAVLLCTLALSGCTWFEGSRGGSSLCSRNSVNPRTGVSVCNNGPSIPTDGVGGAASQVFPPEAFRNHANLLSLINYVQYHGLDTRAGFESLIATKHSALPLDFTLWSDRLQLASSADYARLKYILEYLSLTEFDALWNLMNRFNLPTLPMVEANLELLLAAIQSPLDEQILVPAIVYSRTRANAVAAWSFASPSARQFTTAAVLTVEMPSGGPQIVRVDRDGLGAGLLQTFTGLSFPAEGNYAAKIQLLDSADGPFAESEFSIFVDTVAPTITMLVGRDVANFCQGSALAAATVVSTKVIPVSYCAADPGNPSSGVKQVCIQAATSPAAPAPDSPCWQPAQETLRPVVLSPGANQVYAHVKDNAGYVSQISGGVTLNLGLAPKVEILEPKPQEVSAAKWQAGQSHTFRFKVTDDDTTFSSLRTVISLLDANDDANFRHLACNFSNDAVTQFCPDGAVPSSPLISSSAVSQTFSFTFVVPADWDQNKKYLLLATVIDQSGNASIRSSQELNAPYEVVAGVTYRGIGGTGTTMAADSHTGLHIVSDRRGSLLIPARNLRFSSSTDNRSCRMLRLGATDRTAFDCPDVIETPYASSLLGYPWAYDSTRDVFYARINHANQRLIGKIDFNARRLDIVFGGAGKTNLTSNLPPQALSTDYRNSSVYSFLFFDAASQTLLFRSRSQLYAIGPQNQLRFIAGADLGADFPPDQNDVAQAALVLPDEDEPFAFSTDRRLLISGEKAANKPFGSFWGLQYLAGPLDFSNPAAPTDLIKISTPAGTDRTNYDLGSISYDPTNNRFYGSNAWVALSYMALPPLGSPASAYTWNDLILRSESTLVAEETFLQSYSPSQTTPFPIVFGAFPVTHTLASSSLIYFYNSMNGTILSLDLTSKAIDRYLGTKSGTLESSAAQNQVLDTVRTLAFDNQGKLLLRDFYSTLRVTTGASLESGGQIERLDSAIGFGPFVFRSATNEVFQANVYDSSVGAQGGLRIFNYDELSASTASIAAAGPVGYPAGYTLNNNLDAPKVFGLNGEYDENSGVTHQAWAFQNAFGPRSALTAAVRTAFSAADLFGLGVNFCSGVCNQGTLVSNYYAASSYRLAPVRALYRWRSPISKPVYLTNDTDVLLGHADKFMLFDTVSSRVYELNAEDTSATRIVGAPGAIFENTGGKTYLAIPTGTGRGVYEVNAANAKVDNKLRLTPIPLDYDIANFRAIHVKDGFLYFSDSATQRVIRHPLP